MMTWIENARKVTPYVPGEQPIGDDIIKLNTNENPYPPSPGVSECLRDFPADSLRKYPEFDLSGVRNAIALYHGISQDNVFVGVGSDDVLATAFLAFFNSDSPILFPDITYSFYEVWAELFNIPYKLVPLDDDFNIKRVDFTVNNGGIVLANPNAPTGIYESLDTISQIAYLNPGSVIIVDEAYIDFGGETAVNLFTRHENLLTVRTFSKSRSLAGTRIGYAVGEKTLIKHLFAVRNSFNSYTIDSISQAIAIASIGDDYYFKESVKSIIETREWFKEEMRNLGFSFPDSCGNFLFVSHESALAEDIYNELRKKQIYVRYFKKDRIKNYLRITIGKREEMETLLTNLKEILQWTQS